MKTDDEKMTLNSRSKRLLMILVLPKRQISREKRKDTHTNTYVLKMLQMMFSRVKLDVKERREKPHPPANAKKGELNATESVGVGEIVKKSCF